MRPSSRFLTFGWLALLPASFVGCIPEFDDDLALVQSPRVLAVRAEPAEAPPGTEVRLSALVASPEGVSPQELDWALCLNRKPLTELGPVAQRCVDRFGSNYDGLRYLDPGSTTTATLPPDACRLFGPLQPPSEDGRASGRPVDPDLSGGYYQPVVLGADETSLASVRISCGVVGIPNDLVIVFNRAYRPNENPEVDGLVLVRETGERVPLEAADGSGESVRVKAGEELELEVAWAACPREPVCGDGLCTSGEDQVTCPEDCRNSPKGCTGAENYPWADAEARRVEERRESISVAWFSTSGRFAGEQTAVLEEDPDTTTSTNGWTAPSTSGPVDLWIVIRDDRGGAGWRRVRLEVAP